MGAIADPDLAAELTLQPVRRYGVDAAILFSDIVVPVHAIGFGVEIVAGRGPVVAEPFTSSADLRRLRPLEPEIDVPYVIESARHVARELSAHDVALIGFAGAPFTVASYLVEGGPTRTFAKVKGLMHTDAATWEALMDRLADLTVAFLRAQVAAGATALQLFDSWAGCLSPSEYERSVLPVTARVLHEVADLGVPTILFGVGTGELLAQMSRQRRRRHRRRLAGAARRGPRPGRAPAGGPGQPRSGAGALPLAGGRPGRPRGARRRRQRARAHLQPRPRRAARNRPRHPGRAGRPRAHRRTRRCAHMRK